jgi:hypothetical protein
MIVTYQPRRTARRLGLRGLGDSATGSSLITGITQNSLNPFVFLPADWAFLTQPDQSFMAWPSFDTLSNAAYGTLTQGQYDTLAQQATQEIVRASNGNTDLAAQQIAAMKSDLNSLAQMNGGIAPSISNIKLPPPPGGNFDLTDPTTWPWYLWLALAGGIYLVVIRR